MSEPLKNMYNEQSVATLATAVAEQYPQFDLKSFQSRVFDAQWDGRELKQRMRHITFILGEFLPADYRTSLEILGRVLPTLNQGFEKMVFPDFVEVYGQDDWEASIPALGFFTQFVSAEFAIRPFIQRYFEPTMAQMQAWSHHEHAAVRRLSSEGCRPRLPWGMALPALKADPSPILPILEQLKNDASESVRRSVANNLNDISKDNPDVVIEILERWQVDDSDEIRWITSHALRTLLKQGRPEALELLGYPSQPAIAVHNLTLESDSVAIGEKIGFAFEIESLSDEPQNLMIDYIVYLLRANGKQTAKVFKLSKRIIQPGEIIQIARQHSFKPVTTRKYYPGAHAIEPQINGQQYGRVEFALNPEETSD